MIHLLLLSLTMLNVPLFGADHLIVPRGYGVMIDGKISGDEWADAAHVDIAGGGRLFFKTAAQYVYFGVQLPSGRSGFVDLYLAAGDGKLYDLHASAKLGQRLFTGSVWPEWSTWWNNQGWVANVSRVGSFDDKKFLNENVREFQIDLNQFGGREWKIMLEISLADGQNYTVAPFPAKADTMRPETWLVFDMPDRGARR